MLWRLRRAARIRGRFRRAGRFFCGGREKTVGAIWGLRGIRPADAVASGAFGDELVSSNGHRPRASLPRRSVAKHLSYTRGAPQPTWARLLC